MENMKLVGEVEKQLAVERNDTINGIPYITIVADGSWMKRSYGNAYNSFSGIGVIIGYHTKKFFSLVSAINIVQYVIWQSEKVSNQELTNAIKILIATQAPQAWRAMLSRKDLNVASKCMG